MISIGIMSFSILVAAKLLDKPLVQYNMWEFELRV